MLNTAVIICEYNPFHNGHLHQIAELKRAFGDVTVICVMSGHFVQRGDAAITDKYTRAQMALEGGADLVLELPFPYSCGSAEYFAGAGVRIADCAGADILCFGSESADIDSLRQIAAAVDSEVYRERLEAAADDEKNEAVPFAVRREAILHGLLPEIDPALYRSPNDILGVEYIRAVNRYAPRIFTFAAERKSGAGFKTASEIRELLTLGNDPAAGESMPERAFLRLKQELDANRAPVSLENAERAILGVFRLYNSRELDAAAECGGGLSRRLIGAARQSQSFHGMLERAATKMYTDARIRRAVIYAMTGVPQSALDEPPRYTMLLAANRRGRDALSRMNDNGRLPVITKPADYAKAGDDAAAQFKLTIRADALYTLCMPFPVEAGHYLRSTPYIIE